MCSPVACSTRFVSRACAPSFRLWHQVSTLLLSFLSSPAFPPPALLALQENVVSRIYAKLAPFEYVRWAIAVSQLVGGGSDVAASLAHVESVVPHIVKQSAGQTSIEQDEQALALLQLEIARRKLALGEDADAVKDRLTASKKTLDAYSGVMDARVYASYYQASYEYSKVKGNPQEYYTNSLLYLTYTPLASIPASAQSQLASDIGLAALLGKNIYNFGELLQHPILNTLDGTEYAWLPKMLQTFNKGDIPEFNNIFSTVKDKYVRLTAAQPPAQHRCRVATIIASRQLLTRAIAYRMSCDWCSSSLSPRARLSRRSFVSSRLSLRTPPF